MPVKDVRLCEGTGAGVQGVVCGGVGVKNVEVEGEGVRGLTLEVVAIS